MEEVGELGERLSGFCQRFQPQLRTQTRDTSVYGFHYISGLLRMESDRNIANVGWKTNVPGQNLQHFISNSPWSGPDLIEAIQKEIGAHPAFQAAMLVLDESAEEKAGPHSAGAGRQHNGRLGKIEMSQVGCFYRWSRRRSTPGSTGVCICPNAGLAMGMRNNAKHLAFLSH